MSDSPFSPWWKPSWREWGPAALLSLGTSLALVAPFFRLGSASGHDIAFHLASWLEVAGQWKQGVCFARWAEWANFGFGEPRFIFYPPLSWLLGAFLGAVVPWRSVDAVFIVCSQTLAGLSAYALLRRLAGSRFSALLGAACFTANPYALLIIYMRSDFAELLAMALFPLLLLESLRLAGIVQDQEPKSFRETFLFALLFCAVWLSNAPAAVIATYSVGLLFACCALLQRALLPLTRGLAGMALGFALASFYLIPAVYEQRWVNIAGALSAGLKPAENFLYAKTADAEHDAFNRIASHVAALLMVWFLVAAIAAWRRLSDGAARRESQFFLPTVALGAAAAVLMLPVSIFFWRLLPELQFVQFPWRWMSVLALSATVFTAASARGWLRSAWLLVATLAIAWTAHHLVSRAWWDSEDMPALQAAIEGGQGFEGTDEYDPVGDDRTDLPQKQPRASWLGPSSGAQREVRVQEWTAEHRVIRVVSGKPGRLALHLLDYPAWRVTVNGARVSPQHPGGTAQMIIPVPAGESELRVDFTRTMDRTLGGAVSLASLVASVAMLIGKKRAAEAARR